MSTILVTAALCLVPSAALCDLAPYSQDFEGLVQADPGALAADGWTVYGNVFGLDWAYWYGYGPYSAPNGGPGFCGIDVGQGGPDQAEQQLVVYSDYNNPNQPWAWIEANTFQEQTIGAADVGTTWQLLFDAKRGNIEGGSSAKAFFKTLDPAAGYALTNFIFIDMTGVPPTWGSYMLSIAIDPSLEGQILQFGFLATATAYQGSGVFYDNVRFRPEPMIVDVDIKPGACPNPVGRRSTGVLPVAVAGTAELDVFSIDVSTVRLEGVAPLQSGYDDESVPLAGGSGDECSCNEGGADGFTDLTLKFDTQELLAAIGSPEANDHPVTLTGMLMDGTPIEGVDCIFIVGGGGKSVSNPTDAPTSSGPTNFGLGSSVGTGSVTPSSDDPRNREPEDVDVDLRKGSMRRMRERRE